MKLLVTEVDRDQVTEIPRLFPGENAMGLALVSPEQADGLTIALRELMHGFLPAQGLMAFSLDAVPLLQPHPTARRPTR